MTTEERPLPELFEKLETAWNVSNSVAWAALFAEGADFIRILGGHDHTRVAIEQGHRTVFDTIRKGSHNSYTVEGVCFVRLAVAVVFIHVYLRWYWNGAEQHIEARPTLVVHKKDGGQWEIVTLQNTLITPGARTLNVVKKLTDVHPYKGDTPVKNVSGVRIVQESQASLRNGELWRPHKAPPELPLRAPGFWARNLSSFGEGNQQIPRFARDDKAKAFVSLFSETQSVTRA
jgi:uncharacterized protein (TIGR02246 family)